DRLSPLAMKNANGSTSSRRTAVSALAIASQEYTNGTHLTGIGQLKERAVPCFQLVSEARKVLLGQSRNKKRTNNMRTGLLWFLPTCLSLGQLANGAPACGGHGDHNTLLVTTSWLADHLKDPNLVILGVGPDDDYEKGHIPGSLFVKYMDTHLMKSPAGLTVELPPMSELADTFG